MPPKTVKQLVDPDNQRVVFSYSASPGSRVVTYRTELEPGGRVPLHRHADLVEVIEVQEGERALTVGGVRKLVRGGDTEVVPANTTVGIVEPQDDTEDGPFAFTSRLVHVGPPLRVPGLGVRRIVAVSRSTTGRIVKVRYDDGTMRTVEEAAEDADRGLVQGVHSVRPKDGPPYLRVHRMTEDDLSLDDLPTFRDPEDVRA